MAQVLLVQMITNIAWYFMALCRQRYWDPLSSFCGAVLPRAVRILVVHSKECSLWEFIALLGSPFRQDSTQI